MNRFKEIILSVNQDFAGKPVQELVRAVQDLALERQVRKSFFRKDTLSLHARQMVETINSTATKKFHMDHLEAGFVSARYRWKGEMVMDQDALARVWGTMRLGVKEALLAQARSKK